MAVVKFLLLTVVPLVVSHQVITDSAIGCELDKVKAAAKILLVDGTGTSREGKTNPFLDSVASIDRVLTVKYEVPALEAWPKEEEQKWTCDMQFTCGATNIEVCPGVEVNTAQVRTFGGSDDMVNPISGANTQNLKPQVSFTADKGKFYSLLFMDLLQPGSTLDQFLHWAVYNIGDTGKVADGEEFDGQLNYLTCGNSNLNRNQYTFLLFEHDEEIILPVPNIGNFPNFNGTLEVWLEENSFTSADLRAVNWMSVQGSPLSNVFAGRFGRAANIKPEICEEYSTSRDMCNPQDSSAASLSLTGIFVIILVSITGGKVQE